jgi:hypothetical protein
MNKYLKSKGYKEWLKDNLDKAKTDNVEIRHYSLHNEVEREFSEFRVDGDIVSVYEVKK